MHGFLFPSPFWTCYLRGWEIRLRSLNWPQVAGPHWIRYKLGVKNPGTLKFPLPFECARNVRRRIDNHCAGASKLCTTPQARSIFPGPKYSPRPSDGPLIYGTTYAIFLLLGSTDNGTHPGLSPLLLTSSQPWTVHLRIIDQIPLGCTFAFTL